VAVPLVRFVALHAFMYVAFGVISPFLPRFLESRGLTPEQIGIFFGLGTAARLLSAPVAGRIADLSGALRTVLAVCGPNPSVITPSANFLDSAFVGAV
jgi:PPP family 3-phenylpropionic acid transporter